MFTKVIDVVLISALAAAVPAFADTLSTTGSVSISNGAVQFYPLNGVSGSFNVGPPDTGVFSGLVGTAGTILDLSSLPVNTTIDIPDFMTFAGAPNLSVTLTELQSGLFATCTPEVAAAGQSCTPKGTPYNLSNETATSSIGSATVDGYLVNSNTPGVLTPLSGVFTTQFVNMSYQQLIAQIDSGGSVDSTYSAEFITTPLAATPEPGTIVLLLAGLAMLALASAKSFRKTPARLFSRNNL